MLRSIFFILTATLSWTVPAWAGPDCECIAYGTKFKEGTIICIRLGDKSHLARCEMSQNNTMWRKLVDGCPTAALESLISGSDQKLNMSIRQQRNPT